MTPSTETQRTLEIVAKCWRRFESIDNPHEGGRSFAQFLDDEIRREQEVDCSANHQCKACGRFQLFTFDQGWICPECSGRYAGKFPLNAAAPAPAATARRKWACKNVPGAVTPPNAGGLCTFPMCGCDEVSGPQPVSEPANPHLWSYINTLLGWKCSRCEITDRGQRYTLPIFGCIRSAPIQEKPAEKCPHCGGTGSHQGVMSGPHWPRCDYCGGSGEILPDATTASPVPLPTPPDAAQGKPHVHKWERFGDFWICDECNHRITNVEYREASGTAREAPSKASDIVSASPTTTGESGLRECPFCGATAVEIQHDDATKLRWISVVCMNCGCRTKQSAHEDRVVTAWNRRASTPRAREEVPQIGDNGGWIYLSENSPSIKHAVQDTRVWLTDGTYIAGRRVGTEGGNEALLIAALKQVRAYNQDVPEGKINYRPLDHIYVIDKALAALTRQADGGTK